MCPGSLRVVPCGPFARVVTCPICKRKLKPVRKTLDGTRAQLRSHTTTAPAAPPRP